jgi:O-antigen/teichoic acid export membrane protein
MASETTAAGKRDAPRGPLVFIVAKIAALRASAQSFRSILRLRPFDASTPENRSKERYRRAALTTIATMVARALGVFTGLAYIRLSLSYLGKERYGLWMAVASLVAWANLADLGLARGMQNHLSQANGQDDREAASRYVSVGFITLAALALGLAILFLPVLFMVPWTELLKVQNPELALETRQVVAAVLGCFLLGFPLSVVPTIYLAYQRGYIAAVFDIAGSLLSLVALFAVTRLEVSLPWLILITSGTGVAMMMVNFGYALREMPWLRPRLRLVSRTTLRALAGTSAALFTFQIGALLINETQSIIIARRLGLERVTDWSVFMRVYLLPHIFIQMIASPLIPAFREAHVRGEREWLRRAFMRVTGLKLAVVLIAASLFVVCGNWVATLISGQPMNFTRDVWVACALLLLVAVWNGAFIDLMIAVDRLKMLVVTVLLNGLVTPVLTYFFAGALGILGVVLATMIFSVAVNVWLLPVACRDLLRRSP